MNISKVLLWLTGKCTACVCVDITVPEQEGTLVPFRKELGRGKKKRKLAALAPVCSG